MFIKELRFGIRQYSYSHIFSEDDKNKLIEYLNENFYDNFNNYRKDLPGFQTTHKSNLLEYPIFTKVKKTFIESCFDYIDEGKLISKLKTNQYGMYSWCYMNWKISSRSGNVFHIHNPTNPYTLTGIFYLNLPNKKEKNRTETTFFVGCNKVVLPSLEYNWFIFPSSFGHYPGECVSEEKRYVISSDIWFECDDLPV
jgi:hypothetical protein